MEIVPVKPLTQQQLSLLQEIAMEGDWHVAATKVGMTYRQVRALFTNNPMFKQAYDDLFTTEELKTTARELEMASSELGQLYQDAMSAEMAKQVLADCPACGHKFKLFVKVMDWATKLKAGETLLKITRLLKDEKSVKMEGKATVEHVHMELADKVAIWRVEMGLPVPPHIHDRLVKLGLLTEGQRSANVMVDGESRFIDEEVRT